MNPLKMQEMLEQARHMQDQMQEKLSHVQPRTLAQASRIPGVTPAAVSLVNVYIEIQARRREHAAAI